MGIVVTTMQLQCISCSTRDKESRTVNFKQNGGNLVGVDEGQGFGTRMIVLCSTFPTLKPRPNALNFSLYIARQMSSIVEFCREGVAKRSRLFT